MEAFNRFEPSFFQALQQARFRRNETIAGLAKQAYQQTQALRGQSEDSAPESDLGTQPLLTPDQLRLIRTIVRDPQQDVDRLISGLQLLKEPAHWQLSVNFINAFDPPVVHVQRLPPRRGGQDFSGGSIDFYC
ncbi:MAG: hypothetical protein ACE3JK_08425 [Sporolactobacillus sp.]